MNQKLMPYIAGALTALAFAALPTAAGAGEFVADCETGSTCTATASGGHVALLNTNGDGYTCTALSGTVSVFSGGSTGTSKFILTGCRETITGFGFACSNTSMSGRIETNTLAWRAIYIEPDATTPGLLLTGLNMTLTCAGFIDNTFTGDVIGTMQNPNCGSFSSSHSVTFAASTPGHQEDTQITTDGPTYELISNNDSDGEYLATSFTPSFTSTYTKNRVRLTC
jgi:hypothetical protein